MLNTLIENALNSTPQGFVGVTLIFLYFIFIIGVSLYRIKKGDHMHH